MQLSTPLSQSLMFLKHFTISVRHAADLHLWVEESFCARLVNTVWLRTWGHGGPAVTTCRALDDQAAVCRALDLGHP